MKIKKILLISLSLLTLWIAMDLLIVAKSDVRRFDPAQVARSDMEMWRSYYDRKPIKLFLQLGSLMREKYRAGFWHSRLMAFQAAKAAFIFKKGEKRADYEKALPALRKYYAAINRISKTGFEAEEAAKLELEWWIIHRHEVLYQKDELEKALAASAAIVYQVSPNYLMDYASLRAAAMDVRDTKAEENVVSEEDWLEIHSLLDQSWQLLFEAVNLK